MDSCAVVIPFFDRCRDLSTKIEDALSGKIREASRQMAEKILVNPKLESMTQVIHEHVLALGTDIASAALNDLATEIVQPESFHSKGLRTRNISTILGSVSYEREAFYNTLENKLVFPADDELDVCQGQLQPDVLSRVTRLGIEVPFSEAVNICEALMGIKISEGSIYNTVVTAGQKATYDDVVPSKQELHQKLDHLKQSNPGEPVHIVVGVDGAMEPLRPQSSRRKGQRGDCFWKECKGFRAFAIVGESTIEHLVSWHQIGNDEELGRHLRFLATSLSGRKEQIVVVADGAKWIWNQVSGVFHSQIEVLDWYHVIEHLGKFADLQFKDQTQKKSWLEKSKERLMNDDVKGIIHGLVRMDYKNEAAEKSSTSLQNYLESNKRRMKYGSLRKQGLTIGSGGMESANKSVSHIRLKRNGCWWKPSHANEMLKLRCAKANSTLDKFLLKCWGNT